MPFKDLAQLKAALSGAPDEPQSDGRPLVVVVDDDTHVRSSLELLFQRRYRVKTCVDAEEGVAAIRDDVSVVVLDVKMTGMDGFAAYERMRAKDLDLPIIFYSAYQDIKDPYEILNEYRPFGYITKGEGHETLLRSVEAAIAQRLRATRYRSLISDLSDIQAQMEALRKRIVGG
jgi:DNA-binding NtrC family response regulator